MNLIDFSKQMLASLYKKLSKLITEHLPSKHQKIFFALLVGLCILLILPESEPLSSSSGNKVKTIVLSKGNTSISVSTKAKLEPLQSSPIEETLDQNLATPTTSETTELESTFVQTSATPESSAEQNSELEQSEKIMTTVRRGDNLSLIFDRVGLSPQDVYRVSNSGDTSGILTRLYPGYKLEFDIDKNQSLNGLEVIINPLESYVFTKNNQTKYDVSHIEREPQILPSYKEASINNSLFLAAQNGGISAAITMEVAGIFGGVIDFLLDTRVGDSFNVLYDEKYLDGEFIGNGSIQVAQYTNQGETFTAIRYVNLAGEVDYYNLEGESMRKAFLRNPVDFTRISSNFTLSRKHPILNTIRAHKGTDYAAPRGTPIVASGDGRVTWASRNGSFGNLVVIKHGERYETKYAHLSSYARGIRVGSRVKQGDVIGYVGSTGGATGPHLHYEFLVDGSHRNPRTIHNQLPKAESVPTAEIERFHQQTQLVLAQLDAITTNPTLAQNNSPSQNSNTE